MTHLLLARGERRRLPDLRKGTTQKITIEHPDNKLYIRTGEYEDGTLGEIFLDMHKQGAQLQAFMHSLAIVVSIDLQYGVPLGLFIDCFNGFLFRPNGPVSGHTEIRTTTSILDAVFRHLGILYLKRHDLADPPQAPQPAFQLRGRVLPSTTIRRGEREILPARRPTFRQKLTVGGQRLYFETGHYGPKQTDRIGELFISMHKEGDDLRAMMNAFGIAVSFGLQYGVPLNEFVDSFVGTNFEPSGKVKGYDLIRHASSCFDCIFRIIGIEHLNREDLLPRTQATLESEASTMPP